MRDISVVVALVIATFGFGVVTYYGWPERKLVPLMGLMIKVMAGGLIFLWVSIVWLWFSV